MSPYMRQLAMYSYLVSESQKGGVDISRLLFLEAEINDKNKIYQSHIDNEKIDLLRRDIKGLRRSFRGWRLDGRNANSNLSEAKRTLPSLHFS